MATSKKFTLIVSEDKEPVIKVKPGQTIELVEIGTSDGHSAPQAVGLATLCGHESTYCVAVIEVGQKT